jgi:hypothetical protein
MPSVEERRIAFGFPVNAPGGRLRCWGEARVSVPVDLPATSEPNLGVAIAAAVSREIAIVAARRGDYEEAFARAEAVLRGSPPLAGVEVIGIETAQLADADRREVFARRPRPANGPVAGSAVMAHFQGQWYPARVVEIVGEQAKVQWEGADTLAWVPVPELRPRG